MEVGRGIRSRAIWEEQRLMLPDVRQSGCPLSYLGFGGFLESGYWTVLETLKMWRTVLESSSFNNKGRVRRMEVKESAREWEVSMSSVSQSWEGAVWSRFGSGGGIISQL